MDTLTNEIDVINSIRSWSVERITELTNSESNENALSLMEEFEEWIVVDAGSKIDYLCIENISNEEI